MHVSGDVWPAVSNCGLGPEESNEIVLERWRHVPRHDG